MEKFKSPHRAVIKKFFQVHCVPNIPTVAGLPAANTISVPSTDPHPTVQQQATYPTAAYNSSNNVMATLLAYLYGSLMPALLTQRPSNATQNSSAQQHGYPMQYYPTYPAYQPMVQAGGEPEAVNERVSRAVPLENAPVTNNLEAEATSAATPKNLETLPLDLIKHVVYKKHEHEHHHKHKHVEKKKEDAENVTAVAQEVGKTVELPIVCPKCGSKMKLVVGLSLEGASLEEQHQHSEFCTCEETKPRYACECTRLAVPQICAICNKIKRYQDVDFSGRQLVCTWKQPAAPTPVIILRRTTSPVSYRRNVFTTIPQQDSTNYLDNIWQQQQQTPQVDTTMRQLPDYGRPSAPVEPAITKRYAILPSNELGYQQPQSWGNFAGHEPTCYCWRCRVFGRY